MTECKPVVTPIDKDKPGPRMGEDPSCNWDLYLKPIGSLCWITIGTHPDISFAVLYQGRVNANASLVPWTCAKRVLRYLKGTKHLKLSLGGELQESGELKEGFTLSGYVDSDFAGEASSLKSTTGYVLLLRSGIVQWHSKRQSITASSPADAESIAIASAIQDLVWFRQLVQEMTRSSLQVSTLFNDNQASLSKFKDTTYKPHSKHISVRVHQIKEFIEDGKDVVMDYSRTDKMIADGLTKPLVVSKHLELVRMCGLL